MKRWLPVLLALGLAAYLVWPTGAKRYPPGILVAEEPQQMLVQTPKSWRKNGYDITPLAEFQLQARVLSAAPYWTGRETDLSRVDLVLGWGVMSDQRVLDRIKISQSSRWYHWSTREFPIPREEIESHSANMHMIPASAAIEKRLKSIRRGDLVTLNGYLVHAKGADGWTWQSSLSRTDTGPGACELVWVQSLSIR